MPHSSNLNSVSRIIGDLGESSGPTVVFIGGIHGNEPSGVIAIQQVCRQLQQNQTPINGRILGLAGNLKALSKRKRFISRDLNRIWDNDFTQRFRSRMGANADVDSTNLVPEFEEQIELFEIIEPLLKLKTPVYFLDLHTTSSDSEPFIAMNDQLANRNFALKIPVKKVLGIEEYLHGPLLSYLNEFGHVALAFEAGQHDAPMSIKLHESFVYLALAATGIVDATKIEDLHEHQTAIVNTNSSDQGFFEVIFRKAVSRIDEFKMKPGFQNFDQVKKQDVLADDRNGPVKASRGGKIFMPLYQNSGEDGFFVVRPVPKWALMFSSFLRRVNFERVLTLLPGVSRSSEFPDALIVNKRIAFLLATEMFHLLGYRRKKSEGHRLIFSRREIR